MRIARQSDGVLFGDWKVEQGKLVRTITQPTENAILAGNSEIQKNPDALRDLEVGVWMGRIPEVVFWWLLKKVPALKSPDVHERTDAWLKVLNDRDYERLRVRARRLARRRHGKAAAARVFPRAPETKATNGGASA